MVEPSSILASANTKVVCTNPFPYIVFRNALPVLALALQQKIRQQQLFVELELPKSAGWTFYKEVRNLLVDLRKANDRIVSLTACFQKLNFSIEIIACLAETDRR